MQKQLYTNEKILKLGKCYVNKSKYNYDVDFFEIILKNKNTTNVKSNLTKFLTEMGFQELPNYEPPQTVKSLVDQIISSNPNWDLKAQSQFKTIIQQQLSLNFNTLLVDRSRWIPPISPISKSLPSLIIQSAETRKLRYRSMAAYKEDVNDLRLVVNEISKELQELNINTDNIKEFSTDDAFVVLEDLQEKFSDKKQIVEKIEKVARRLAVLNTPIGR
jgi:hypothetical protein